MMYNYWYRELNLPNSSTSVGQYVADRTSQQHQQQQHENIFDQNIPSTSTDQPDNDISENSWHDFSDDDSDDNENTEVLSDIIQVTDQIKQVVSDNINNDEVKKSAKYFVKKMKQTFKGTIQNFVSAMYRVGQTLSGKKKSGRKVKRSGGIHVQPTAISRRVSKHRGRGNAPSGRKPKQQPARVQLHVDATHDAGITLHSLPTRTLRARRTRHSLKESVFRFRLSIS